METEEIIRKAFAAGESWGVCYSTWFIPTKEDTEERIQAAIKKIQEEEDGS